MKCQTCNCEADSRFDPLCGYCRAAKLSDERFGLQRQLAAVTAERDEAVAKAEEAISAVEEYLTCVHGLEQAKLTFDYGALSEFMDRMIPARDALAAIINKETP